ncbi:MAG: FAD-dependent oxidoreductase [Limnochordia bacterium]
MDFRKVDVVVIGGGGAGARAALEAGMTGLEVMLMVKGPFPGSGSTSAAFAEITQFAAATDSNDDALTHAKDTIQFGGGLCKEELVQILAQEAPARLRELKSFGVEFAEQGEMDLGFAQTKKRGHLLRNRHAIAIVEAIKKQLESMDNVYVQQQCMAVELIHCDDRIAGVVALDTHSDSLFVVGAKAIVLATGGAHDLFPLGPSTVGMTGDGYAMCLKAGLPLINMGVFQVGPTVVLPRAGILAAPFWRLQPSLINGKGEEFLPKYLPRGITVEDVMATAQFPYDSQSPAGYLHRSIYGEVQEFGCWELNPIYADLTHVSVERIVEEIPFTYRHLLALGIDLHQEPVPLTLACQCFHGGVEIDSAGATAIQGLFAAGEVSGGLRGYRRPAGNCLAEGQVFGRIAGGSAAEYAKVTKHLHIDKSTCLQQHNDFAGQFQGSIEPRTTKAEIQKEMFRNVLLEPDRSSIDEALKMLEEREQAMYDMKATSRKELYEIRNLMSVGKQVLYSMKQLVASWTSVHDEGSLRHDSSPQH